MFRARGYHVELELLLWVLLVLRIPIWLNYLKHGGFGLVLHLANTQLAVGI